MSHEGTEVFSKDTFLTALRNGSAPNADATAAGSKPTIEEPAAMAIVREKHAQLHEVVGSLSEKISAVLGRQEKDFLAAYRAHMYNVQKELHELREKMRRNETVENKTEKIKKIEEERDWYRKEALRLDAFTTSMTKDLKYMREKLESIEEDRNWLEKQLKACKKQNKLLRAELDVRVTTGTVAVNASFDTTQLPSFDSPKPTIAGRRSSSKSKVHEAGENDNARLPSLPLLVGDPAHGPPQIDEREERLRKQIKSLKKDLQVKIQEIAMLKQQQRSIVADDGEDRSHLESLFLRCVESVKEEVARRKTTGGKEKGQHRPALFLARNQCADAKNELAEFASADRVRVIERLLAHDEVLTLLYGQLFPTEQLKAASPSSVQRPTTTDGETRASAHGTMQASDSTKSLPDTSSSPSVKRVNFDMSDSNARGSSQAAGSGAAAVSAAKGAGGLPIDESTRDYLRSMKLGSS